MMVFAAIRDFLDSPDVVFAIAERVAESGKGQKPPPRHAIPGRMPILEAKRIFFLGSTIPPVCPTAGK